MHTILVQWSSKIQARVPNFIINFLIALLILLNAEAGRLLGIQGILLAISPIWPATGFSLAALLLFGYKVAPGVFFGNLIYNLLQFHTDNLGTALTSSAAAIAISTGSFIQAIVGKYCVQKYCSKDYFNNVRDAFLFIIFGGLLTCCIASTIGVTTLYLYGDLSRAMLEYAWLNFWIGDSLGVLIFTPLLVVWSTQRSFISLKQYRKEVSYMLLSFFAITIGLFIFRYPFIVFLVLFNIWVAYRFHFHGATVAIACTGVVLVGYAAFGYRHFILSYPHDIFVLTAVFLEIMVMNALLIAGMGRERPRGARNISGETMEGSMHGYLGEIEHFIGTVVLEDKLTSLKMLASGIAKRIQVPLEEMEELRSENKETLQRIQILIDLQKSKLPVEFVENFQKEFDKLKSCCKEIATIGEEVSKVTKVLAQLDISPK